MSKLKDTCAWGLFAYAVYLTTVMLEQLYRYSGHEWVNKLYSILFFPIFLFDFPIYISWLDIHFKVIVLWSFVALSLFGWWKLKART